MTPLAPIDSGPRSDTLQRPLECELVDTQKVPELADSTLLLEVLSDLFRKSSLQPLMFSRQGPVSGGGREYTLSYEYMFGGT